MMRRFLPCATSASSGDPGEENFSVRSLSSTTQAGGRQRLFSVITRVYRGLTTNTAIAVQSCGHPRRHRAGEATPTTSGSATRDGAKPGGSSEEFGAGGDSKADEPGGGTRRDAQAQARADEATFRAEDGGRRSSARCSLGVALGDAGGVPRGSVSSAHEDSRGLSHRARRQDGGEDGRRAGSAPAGHEQAIVRHAQAKMMEFADARIQRILEQERRR